MSKLEVLKISAIRDITGSGLGTFPNLKELHINACSNLENDCVIRMLRCSPQLELLDIACFNEKITNAVLNVAFEETKKRKNNIVLEMDVQNIYNIDIYAIDDYSPLLLLYWIL